MGSVNVMCVLSFSVWCAHEGKMGTNECLNQSVLSGSGTVVTVELEVRRTEIEKCFFALNLCRWVFTIYSRLSFFFGHYHIQSKISKQSINYVIHFKFSFDLFLL